MDIMKSSTTSLYESLLDDEEDLINNNSIEEHLLKKWFEENVQPDTGMFGKDLVINIDNRDVTVIGNIMMGEKCDFRAPILKKFNFKKLEGSLHLFSIPKKKIFWLPQEVTGEVYINACGFEELPKLIDVNHVEISYCHKLKTLKGLPDKIDTLHISCCNKFESLEGCPKEINKSLTISYCDKLMSVDSFPKKVSYFSVHNWHDNILRKLEKSFRDQGYFNRVTRKYNFTNC